MKLEASNLGQIIGRFMNPELEGTARRPVKRIDAVLDFVRLRGDICAADLKELGITQDHTYVLLNQMTARGLLVRTGDRCRYRYALPA